MNAKEFNKKVKVTVKGFLKEGRLQDAEQACYEVLAKYPDNKVARALLTKVNEKIDKDIDVSLKAYFEAAIPKLKASYKDNTSVYIQI